MHRLPALRGRCFDRIVEPGHAEAHFGRAGVGDLAGEEFVEVAAWLDDNGRPVETVGMVMGRLRSGAWVTMHGCGEAIPSCASDVRVFCSQAILRTGIWGERLDIQRAGAKQMRPVKVPASTGVWQQFMAVRAG